MNADGVLGSQGSTVSRSTGGRFVAIRVNSWFSNRIISAAISGFVRRGMAVWVRLGGGAVGWSAACH
jgi:hypothetical protein